MRVKLGYEDRVEVALQVDAAVEHLVHTYPEKVADKRDRRRLAVYLRRDTEPPNQVSVERLVCLGETWDRLGGLPWRPHRTEWQSMGIYRLL